MKMKRTLLSIIYMLLITQGILAQTANRETASEAVKNMKVGWNLGNTLEAFTTDTWFKPTGWQDYETLFGNPITKPSLFKMIRKAGFNAVRVPVTWFPHMDAMGNIDKAWMKRVHEVVDYVIDQGMYCILNSHGDAQNRDAWLWADKSYYKEQERFKYMWTQIAQEFQDYDEHLLFAAWNEIEERQEIFGGETDKDRYKVLNQINQDFVDAVRSAGGNNLYRNLVVGPYYNWSGMEVEMGQLYQLDALEALAVPNDVFPGHIIYEVHVYAQPSDPNVNYYFDKTIEIIKKYLFSKNVPVIIGEWGPAGDWQISASQTYKYAHYYISQAKANNIAVFTFTGPLSYGNFRTLPAFESREYIEAILKGYYGDDYEAPIPTIEDFNVGIAYTDSYQDFSLVADPTIDTSKFKGFLLELDKIETGQLELAIISNDKLINIPITSTTTYVEFPDKRLGAYVESISLNHVKEGPYPVNIKKSVLIDKNGEEFWRIDYWNYKFVSARKQFVHTVEFDGNGTELNVFEDDIPLKLKAYKGIRVEFAEPVSSNEFQFKFYGDNSDEEIRPVGNGLSTTIDFESLKFKQTIKRVVLQHTTNGKAQAKVINAWLIRQDGSEEYCDLSPFRGCEIKTVEEYVPEQHVTITANDKSMIYGDDVPTLTYESSGAALKGTPKLSTTATKTSPVGTYPIKVEKGTVTNEQVTYVDGTLTISKAALTVGVKDITITEGDAIPTFTLTYSGFRNGDTESKAFTTKPKATTTAISSSKPGTYTITVSGGEAKNYALTYTQGTLTIRKKDDPTALWENIVVNSDLEGNDLSCFYSRENLAEKDDIVPATIVNGAGKYNTRGIVVQSVDNAQENWNTQFFVRLPQPQPAGTKYRLSFDYKASQEAYVMMEIHGDPSDYIYYDFGNMTFTTSWQHYESEGMITEDMSTAEKMMRTIAFDLAHEKSATTYYFDNIVFEIDKSEMEKPITITANNLSMVYGNNLPTLTYNVEGGELNGTPSLSTTATKTSPVGTYPITVEQGTVTNTKVTYVNGTLTITKAPLTVKAKDVTITEGDAIPAFTLIYSSFRNDDTESNAFTTKPKATTTATSSSKPGTYTITVSGGEATNYTLTYTQGTLTIKEKPVVPIKVTANELTMVYADKVPMLTYSTEGGTLNGTPKLTTTATSSSSIGTYPIKVERGTITNENVVFVDGTLTITKAPLTIGVKDETITEGDSIPTFTLTYDGWRNNDNETNAFTRKPKAKTNATSDSEPGTYPITISNATAKNYKISYQEGTLTIVAASGIVEIYNDSQRNTIIYNVRGQRLLKPKKGINIINGRKIVVK